MLKSMNDAQKCAIMSEDRNLLVLAGPGSGKTFVLTRRLKHLIEDRQVSPDQILTITFTKKAAIEMKDRALAICPEASKVHFGTFHSIFLQILKHNVKYQNFSLITNIQQKQILTEILYAHHFDSDQILQMLQHFLSEISYLKNLGISSEHFQSKVLPKEQFRVIYKSYNEEIHKRGMLDFDDMLLFCYDLLKNNSEELLRWQKQFRYILIDEFQDINGVQYAIIKLLQNNKNEFFVVGDDDQSIYGFRGSNPEFMYYFLRDFTPSKQILLNINYRSNASIVEQSCKFIASNTNRFSKEIQHFHRDGEGVLFQFFEQKTTEESFLISKIKLIQKKEDKASVAILYRTVKQGNEIARLLENNNIIFNREEKNELLYEKETIVDILVYFRLAVGEKKRSDFLLVMNKPCRFIHRNSLKREKVEKNELLDYYKEQSNVKNNIERLFADLDFLSKCDPYSGYTFIMYKMGYSKYLRQIYGNHMQKYEEILELQKEFSHRCKAFDSIKKMLEYIDIFMEQSNKNNSKINDSNLFLMTYHASKGLEFDHVFLPFLTKDQVPHKRATTINQLLEERRVFYVAMTRAKYNLYLSAHASGNGESDMSSYMLEIKMNTETKNELFGK